MASAIPSVATMVNAVVTMAGSGTTKRCTSAVPVIAVDDTCRTNGAGDTRPFYLL